MARRKPLELFFEYCDYLEINSHYRSENRAKQFFNTQH